VERKDLLAVGLIIILLAGVGGYKAYREHIAKAKGVVSKTEVTELKLTPDGERVASGWITATLVVDRRDELTFVVKPEDTKLKENPQKDVPPGSEVRYEGVSVVLRPAGAPYVHGPVRRRGFVYDDKNWPASEDRLWKYYSLATPGWTARHVPYQTKVYDTKTKEVYAGWTTYLVGHTRWDDGTKVELPRNIEMTALGELLNGVVTPSEDYAFIWNVKDGGVRTQYVQETALRDKFQGNPPGPRRVNIAMAKFSSDDPIGDDDGDYKRADGFNNWDRGFWIEDRNTRADIVRTTSDGRVKIRYRSHGVGYTFGGNDTSTTVTFSVSGTQGFEPDKVRVTSEEYDIRKDQDLPRTIPVEDGTFKFEFKQEPEDEYTDGYIWFNFYGATDTWEEFVKQTKISQLRGVTQNFVTDRGEVVGIPSDVTLWNEKPSLYTKTVPETEYESWDRSTGKVAVYKLPGQGARAFVQVKAPANLFDAVVFKPPYGDPKITDVSDVTITGGGRATLTATVKNDGYTEDTFVPSLDLPKGMTVTKSPGEISIPKDETRTFEWELSVGEVESTHDESGSLEVKAKTSLESSSTSFTIHMKESPGPKQKTGDLSVTVLDKKTGAPIEGASVRVAGFYGVTDETGVAVFNDLSTGKQTVTVSKEPDYESKSKDITIREGMNSVTFHLGAPKPRIPWKKIAIVVSVVGAIGAFLYIGRKKRWF